MASEVFSMDTKAVDLFVNSLKDFPKTQKKYAYMLVNDQAKDFKDQLYRTIESTYTIRDEKFIKDMAIQWDRAKTVSSINQIEAHAGTADDSWGRKYKGFTGFVEAITGTPSAKPRTRIITADGRGGSIYNKPEKWAQYRRTGGDSGTGNYPSPESYNYRRGRTKTGKARSLKTIRLSSDEGINASRDTVQFIMMMKHIHYQGLFRLGDSDPRFVKGLYTVKNGPLQQIQIFRDSPILPFRWDFQSEAIEEFAGKYTAEYIFDRYLLPAFNEIQQMARG